MVNNYYITFTDGTDLYEVGTDEQDVRDFLKRSYGHLTVQSIEQIN